METTTSFEEEILVMLMQRKTIRIFTLGWKMSSLSTEIWAEIHQC